MVFSTIAWYWSYVNVSFIPLVYSLSSTYEPLVSNVNFALAVWLLSVSKYTALAVLFSFSSYENSAVLLLPSAYVVFIDISLPFSS